MLAPHRAVYDLTLTRTRGKRQIASVRGRILYDFNGSACEGYALQFRQVSEIDSGEGKVALSDLQATTWEDGDAKTFRFNSKNTVNDRVVDSVDGNAERSPSEVAVKLNKPGEKKLDLAAKIVFPTEHMRRIIDAAKEGKTLLELPVYDGSENGEKTYSTLTVIGKEIPPDEKKPDDAAADKAALAQLKRWPVTISYFEQGAKSGEQLPVYAIGFELYENGISRALRSTTAISSCRATCPSSSSRTPRPASKGAGEGTSPGLSASEIRAGDFSRTAVLQASAPSSTSS